MGSYVKIEYLQLVWNSFDQAEPNILDDKPKKFRVKSSSFLFVFDKIC